VLVGAVDKAHMLNLHECWRRLHIPNWGEEVHDGFSSYMDVFVMREKPSADLKGGWEGKGLH